MEFNCLAEVTFVLWVFMAIITNNRKRLDIAESLSAGWGAGTDSVNVCDLKSKDRMCACTHTPLQAPTCGGIVLGPCVQWPFQKGLCCTTSISHFNLNFHLRFDEERGAHFTGTGRVTTRLTPNVDVGGP